MIDRRFSMALFASVWAAPAAAVAQSKDAATSPEVVVRNLLDAMTANDASRIRAAFGSNATQAYGDSQPKSGAAFRAWLQTDIIDRHGQVSNAQLVPREGGVVVTGQYRNNAGYSSAANFLIKVDAGKIVSWQMRY